MNKKGLSIESYVIGLLLFSAVIGLSYIMIGSLAVEYDADNIVDSSFKEKYNKLERDKLLVSNMLNSTNSEEGLNVLDVGEVLLSGTFSIISLTFGSLSTIGEQIISIPTDFGVPTEIIIILFGTLICILTVTIIFAVINSLNKQRPL